MESVRDDKCSIAESTVELPPGAEDAKHTRPAEHHVQQQGGLAQAKLAGEAVALSPGQIARACEHFARFWHCPVEDVTQQIVEEMGSSLSIEG